MVEFGTGYYMPMDREYSSGKSGSASQNTNDVGVNIGDVGFSIGLGPVPNVPAVGAKMRTGQKTMELTFMGAGKGSGQGHTPGMYGKLQRQALKEMQKANRYDFTTHSSVGVYGLAGMDQQGNFSRHQKEAAVNEIKRAVEFAADVSQGGTVVVHTGEFQRPIVDADWNKDGKFQMYEGEEERASFKVVDNRTGGLINEARKSKTVTKPVWKRYSEGDEYWEDNKGNDYLDEKGQKVKPGDYIDYYGNKIDPALRVPEYDKVHGRFKTKQMGWKELGDEAKELTERAKKSWRQWKDGDLSNDEFNKSMGARFKDAKSENDILIRPEEAYIISTLETNAANSRGWAYNYGEGFEVAVDTVKKLKKAREIYQKIEKATSPEEKWKLKKQMPQIDEFIPAESKYPVEFIDEKIKAQEHRLNQIQNSASAQWSQAEEAMETIRHVESAETYALRESYDAYAQAGMTAMMKSDQLKKKGVLKKPLSIAMENLFPESYGAHPDELINLIKGGRQKMANMLQQRGMSAEQAQEKAKEHITATFDTAHMHLWKKYWKNDPNLSIENNNKNYNKWYLKNVEKMAKSGVIGHLHLVDSWGYQDEHLAPGEGDAPIKETINILKKHGFKGKMIIEPGADFTTDTSGMKTLTKGWKHLGSSIYGAAGAPAASWGQLEYGYMGQGQPPYFVFGGYSPSEEFRGAPFWSGVPLE